MPVLKKFSPPEDRLKSGACRSPDVDPNWWTDVHYTRGHLRCDHALARHLCRFHCPVLAECQEDEAQWGTNWAGMVIAGELRIEAGGKSIPAKVQPAGPAVCKICIES